MLYCVSADVRSVMPVNSVSYTHLHSQATRKQIPFEMIPGHLKVKQRLIYVRQRSYK